MNDNAGARVEDKTEREKMLAGELYSPFDPELVKMQKRAKHLMYKFNISTPPQYLAEQQKIIRQLFGSIGQPFTVNPPLYCDYGAHIFAGDNLYINHDCTILDCAEVHIGDNVLIAPKVQIYTATHPTDPQVRLSGKEFASPIHIGNNVWLGGGTIICPGVSIGDNTTVGAGSVVTKDLPSNAIAVGNPCQVIKSV
ncbi:MAG: sugar O-acetyltransferase [Cyanobacteria bacterium J06621_11]